MELVSPGIGLIFWMTLSFGIVIWLLGKYAWKPIMKSLHEREDSIDKALHEADWDAPSKCDAQNYMLFQPHNFQPLELQPCAKLQEVLRRSASPTQTAHPPPPPESQKAIAR